MSPAEYLSSLTYKHPRGCHCTSRSTGHVVASRGQQEGSHRSGRKVKKVDKQTQTLPHKEQAYRNPEDSRTIIQSFVDWTLYLRESIDSVSGAHTSKLQVQT